MSAFPSSISARKCIRGEGCGETAYWILRRTALIATGMRLAGEKQDLVKKAFAGSLAVQTFVMAWTAAHMDDPEPSLPSGDAAESGNIPAILVTYFTRSAMVASGLYLAGYRKNLARNALAGTAAIEATVLLWAFSKQQSSKPLPSSP